MPKLIETDALNSSHAIAAERTYRGNQRQKLASALDEIASEVTAALSDAGIRIPVFFAVPASGDALVTFATPVEPNEPDWSRACELICGIVGDKVGIKNLYSRHIPCVAAGTPAMAASDVLHGTEFALLLDDPE